MQGAKLLLAQDAADRVPRVAQDDEASPGPSPARIPSRSSAQPRPPARVPRSEGTSMTGWSNLPGIVRNGM